MTPETTEQRLARRRAEDLQTLREYGDSRTCCLLREKDGEKEMAFCYKLPHPTIVHGCVFDKSSWTKEQTYPSLEALLDDGWYVD